MNWLKKIIRYFFYKNYTKELLLKNLKRGNFIIIDAPRGYITLINNIKIPNQPISVKIENNDPINRKIWFFTRVDGIDTSFVISYDSPELENFSLFNDIKVSEIEKETKEELEKQLEKAILEENYEMAKIINNKLKEL